MYSLYYNPGAASFAVHWLLNELKAPHALILVDFDSKQQKSNDYLKLNPGGMVPTLVMEGKPHTECAALLMLLAERHPNAALSFDTDSPQRADYLQWIMFLTNTLQPAFRAWFYPHEPAGESNSEATKIQARIKIEGIWDRINAHLSNRSFMVGDRLSAADFLATMLMRWSRNMPKPSTEWPHIKSYVTRMRALPSFIQTSKAEQLTDWMN